MAAGGLWDLLEIEYVRSILEHLGYPAFLLPILGVWKVPCALVLLVPGASVVNEWAYAGAFFVYTGATASHVLASDGPGFWVAPLVLAGLTVLSWALGPVWFPPRVEGTRPRAWIVPIALFVAFLVLVYMTLPAGPAPMLSGV